MSTKLIPPKNGEIIVHDFDSRIARSWEMIRAELSPEDVSLIEKYDKAMVRMSLSKTTRHKHLATILSLSRISKKSWSNLSKADAEEMVYKVMNRFSANGKETHTTWDHKKVLKIFVRWHKLGSRDHKEVGDPPETKWIKIKRVGSRVVREQLLTDEDLSKLLRVCINPRDKAFLHVHYEAGTRPSEILSLKVKHVKFDNNGAFIYVDGKTGPRPIRLITSVPNLAKWMDAHPLRDNPEGPLWIITEYTKFGSALSYSAGIGILRRAMNRSGLKKKVNLNLFRHSEATNSAKFMNEAQMRKRHGWSATSKMPANYVHLVSADVDETYLKHFGIKTGKEETAEPPKKCPFCDVYNSPTSEYCYKCARLIDLKKALELEEKTTQLNFNANKLAGKVLVQMLTTGQIPKLGKEEINSLVQCLNL